MKPIPIGRIALKQVASGGAAMAIMVIVSCSGEGGPEVSSRGGLGDRSIKVAHAAPLDAGDTSIPAEVGEIRDAIADTVIEADGLPMPENAAHITIRVPKVANKVVVGMMSGAECPFPHMVVEEEDHFMVTLFIPRNQPLGLLISTVGQNHEPIGEATRLSLVAEVSLGTATVELGAQDVQYNFKAEEGAARFNEDGRATLEVVTTEFVDGETREVMRAPDYVALVDGSHWVEWNGAETLYSFADGPPVAHTEPFELELRAGQEPGLWAAGCSGPVSLHVVAPSPGADEE